MSSLSAGAEVLGALIGERHRVQALVAEGGMASVYRARDEHSGRTVALKLQHVHAGAAVSESARLRRTLLEREYHTLVQLRHPRIIRVHDYGVDPLGAYYTMELLPGGSLKERSPMPWRQVCAVVHDLASSLAVLHARRLIHRDIKPSNVCYDAEGRIKLLDFGAMAPVGVVKDVIGTPPFMAPELLERQSVDARADIFALGALAYRLLTGKHAYPARSLAQLRNAWRVTPPPPHQLVPSIPEPLGDLVSDLLQLERAGRPAHVAVVIERVCAIAGLPRDEHEQVQRAYLVTPRLVGREAPLAQARDALARLATPASAVLLLEGEAGMGRSRFLDACLVEAQLRGAVVLRADHDADRDGELAVMRGLLQQALQLQPEVTRRVARSHRRVLRYLAPALDRPDEQAAKPPPRHVLVAALCDFWLGMARGKALALAVDDVDRIDDASASVLAALSRRSERRPLALLLTSGIEEAAAGTPLDVLRSRARRLRLQALTHEDTSELVRSVFGDADQLLPHVGWVHALSRGRPHTQLQLLEHMVDRGIASYEAGHWTLRQHREGELPESLARVLRDRIEALSPAARSLGQAWALLRDRGGLSLQALAMLTSHGDATTTREAIDELVVAGILVPTDDAFRLADAAFRDALEHSVDTDQAQLLHGRLAAAAAHDNLILAASRHALLAGNVQASVDHLLTYLRDQDAPAPGQTTIGLIEDALAASAELPMAGEDRRFLRLSLISLAQLLSDFECFSRHAPQLLEDLERDCGLADYRELEETGDVADDSARLQRAIALATERFEAAPLHERGMPFASAMRAFLQVCASFAGVAASQIDPRWCERVPSLEPFFGLSPAVPVIAALVKGTADLTSGRIIAGQQQYQALLERLDAPDRAGLGRAAHTAIRLAVNASVALTLARLGHPETLTHADVLASGIGHRTNAERIRMSYYMTTGQHQKAEASRRRAEWLQLQEGETQRYPNSSRTAEALAYAWSDDVLGLKRVTQELAAVARRAAWLSFSHDLCRMHYYRVQRDFARCEELLDALSAGAEPARDYYGYLLTTSQLQVLVESGKAEQAVAAGSEYLEVWDTSDHPFGAMLVRAWLGRALVEVGRLDEAERAVREAVREAEALEVAGLMSAVLYEQCARLAIARGDGAAFQRWSSACEQAHGPDPSPAQRAHFNRLLRAASDAGLATRVASDARGPQGHGVAPLQPGALGPALERLQRCRDGGERADLVLSLLLQGCGATAGCLYGLRAGALEVIAARPAELPSPALSRWLMEQLVTDDFDTATFVEPKSARQDCLSFIDAQGARFSAIALFSHADGNPVMGAIAALRTDAGELQVPAGTLLSLLADELLDREDVDPLTRIA